MNPIGWWVAKKTPSNPPLLLDVTEGNQRGGRIPMQGDREGPRHQAHLILMAHFSSLSKMKIVCEWIVFCEIFFIYYVYNKFF